MHKFFKPLTAPSIASVATARARAPFFHTEVLEAPRPPRHGPRLFPRRCWASASDPKINLTKSSYNRK